MIAAALMLAAAWAQGSCDIAASMAERDQGRQALARKQYGAATMRFREALSACPAEHGVWIELSQAHAYGHEFPQAIEAAQRFVELEPANTAGRLALSNAYLLAQRLPEAAREAALVLKADPAQVSALKIKGNCEYLGGRLDDALRTFFILLERHPEDEEGPYMLGRIYYQEGRIDYAIGQFERVLKLNPRSYKAFDNLGLCYEARGDAEMAIRHYLTAIKLVEKDHPEYDWAYANLANLLVERGEAEKAYGAAAKAAERNPYSARNFYIGGKALWKLGKNDLCVNWLERAVSLDAKYAEPLYLLARVYSQMGKTEKANTALEKFRALKAELPRERK